MRQQLGYHAVAAHVGRIGVAKKQGGKMGKPLAALEHFQALGVEKIPARVQEVGRVVYGKIA